MDAAHGILVYFVVPLWLVAGFVDFLCHRATDIEHANGTKESLLHWLMLGEVGVPLLAAVFLKINALMLGFMITCWVAHEITTNWDLNVAIQTRKVTAFEQQVHSALEMLPLMALVLLALLHWPQAQALVGMGSEAAEFSLQTKAPPSIMELAALFAGLFLLGFLPYGNELWRGLRAERG